MKIMHKAYPLFFFLLMSLPVLWQGTSGPLVLDDFHNLAPLLNEENPDYSRVIFGNESGPLGRSISMLTFVVNHWSVGEIKPFDLKITNIFIHMVNGLLLFLLSFFLLKEVCVNEKRHLVALIITLCWLYSPVNTSVLFYSIQRMALLSALFVLAGCCLYVYLKQSDSVGFAKKTILYFLIVCCWLLASLSKENGILLPLFILCIELGFYNDLRSKIKKLSSFNMLVSFLLLLFVFLFFAVWFVSSQSYLDYSHLDFSLTDRLFTQPVVLMDYVYRLILPFNFDIGLISDDVSVFNTFWNKKTIFYSLFLLLVISICVYSLLTKKNHFYTFGLLFFLIGHLLESTFFPLEIYFSHRNYLPSVGLYFFLGLCLYQYLTYIRRAHLFFLIFSIYISLFIFFSYEKSKVWSSEEQIVENAYYYHPLSVRANMRVVELLKNKGKIEEAFAINNSLIETKIKGIFRPIIQRFYLYCWVDQAIPNYEYIRFSKYIDRYYVTETANALQNLLDVAHSTNCSGVNFIALAESMAEWVDSKLQTDTYKTEQLWHIEYYVVEYFLLNGLKEAALQRLDLFAQKGNQNALEYYKVLSK
jgi:protein O-mannosyl-transferase